VRGNGYLLYFWRVKKKKDIMKPIQRFYTIVIALTSVIVFTIWTISSKILIEHIDWKNSTHLFYSGFALVLTYLSSIGVFSSIFTLINYLFSKWKWLKRYVLSSYYLEGTWVGFYIGVSGNVRYIIETYEQTFDSLVIKGTSYDENKNLHTFWTSESYNINAKNGEITYQYKVRSTKENTDPNGIAYFSFIRGNNKKPPKMIVGYSADSHLTMKCKAMEKKYKNSTSHNIDKALEEACIFYQSKKDNVFNYKKKES